MYIQVIEIGIYRSDRNRYTVVGKGMGIALSLYIPISIAELRIASTRSDRNRYI